MEDFKQIIRMIYASKFKQPSSDIYFKLIPPDSAIDPLVTSRSGVWYKRTGVSHLVVKLNSLYRCSLVRLTPYDCSAAIDGSVLTVAVRDRVHRSLRFSLCSSSDIGGGRSFSTMLFHWSWIAESTACVCRFLWFSSCLC